MGKAKDLLISGAAALTLSTLVINSNFNPASITGLTNMDCKMQSEILLDYANVKKTYTAVKFLVFRDPLLLYDFDKWANKSRDYIIECYSTKHIQKHKDSIRIGI